MVIENNKIEIDGYIINTPNNGINSLSIENISKFDATHIGSDNKWLLDGDIVCDSCNHCNGCNATCVGSCYGGCTASCVGCVTACNTGCTSSCQGNCVGACVSGCTTGCNGTCTNGCYSGCTTTCQGTCVNTCVSGCVGCQGNTGSCGSDEGVCESCTECQTCVGSSCNSCNGSCTGSVQYLNTPTLCTECHDQCVIYVCSSCNSCTSQVGPTGDPQSNEINESQPSDAKKAPKMAALTCTCFACQNTVEGAAGCGKGFGYNTPNAVSGTDTDGNEISMTVSGETATSAGQTGSNRTVADFAAEVAKQYAWLITDDTTFTVCSQSTAVTETKTAKEIAEENRASTSSYCSDVTTCAAGYCAGSNSVSCDNRASATNGFGCSPSVDNGCGSVTACSAGCTNGWYGPGGPGYA